MNKFKVDDIVVFTTIKAGNAYDRNWERAVIGKNYTVNQIGAYNFGNGMEDTVVLQNGPGGWIPISLLDFTSASLKQEIESINNNYQIY